MAQTRRKGLLTGSRNIKTEFYGKVQFVPRSEPRSHAPILSLRAQLRFPQSAAHPPAVTGAALRLSTQRCPAGSCRARGGEEEEEQPCARAVPRGGTAANGSCCLQALPLARFPS